MVDEQLARLKRSGLYQAAESIQCCVVGRKRFIPNDKKIQIISHHSDRKKWEWPTLTAMRDFCVGSPDVKVFYFHTKGISLRGNSAQISPARAARSADWRYLMEYFLIDRFQDCVTALDTVDVCGVNFRGGGGKNVWMYRVPHFAGNFWWAKGSYVAGLPVITADLAEKRTDAEFWVGHGEGLVACFYESAVNHCLSDYPESRYARKQKAALEYSKYRLKNKIRWGVA